MNPMLAQIPDWIALRAAARKVRENAWAPYSRYRVGAAVLTDSGEIFTGCNVENASYGLTICAERVAVCSAIAQGHREFHGICISLTGVPVPCGACRQFLMEFSPQLPVILDNLDSSGSPDPEVVLLSDLLPRAFRLEHGSR